MKLALIIPTWNAMPCLPELLQALQNVKEEIDRILFIDSSSVDSTRETIKEAGFEVHKINKEDFGHGKTRNLGAKLCKDADIIIYLTQDAIPAHADFVSNVVKYFKDSPKTALVYGRQLPHRNANVSASFARLHNYPAENLLNTIEDVPVRGIKTFFCSNSFAAYRVSAFNEIGGFPEGLLSSEDLAACARLLDAGYASQYAADSKVYHSHNYSYFQDFTRYFDIGASFKLDQWFSRHVIKSSSKGLSFVIEEFKYTFKNGSLIDCLKIIPHTLVKFIGFKLGKNHKFLPKFLIRKISMHSYHWDTV